MTFVSLLLSLNFLTKKNRPALGGGRDGHFKKNLKPIYKPKLFDI